MVECLQVYMLLALVTFNADVIYADFQCVCNYDPDTPVFPEPDRQGTPIGYMYKFDCKPLEPSMSQGIGFYAIQFEKQVCLSTNVKALKISIILDYKSLKVLSHLTHRTFNDMIMGLTDTVSNKRYALLLHQVKMF